MTSKFLWLLLLLATSLYAPAQVTDNFSGTGPLSSNWTVVAASGYGNVQQASGVAAPNPAGKGIAIYTGTTFPADQYSQVVATLSNVDMHGPCVRMSAAGTGVCWLAGQNVVYNLVNGAGTGTVVTGCPIPAAGDTLRLGVVGSMYYAYDNGALVCSGSDGGANTTGYPGIFVKNAPVAGNSFSAFQADTMPPLATAPTFSPDPGGYPSAQNVTISCSDTGAVPYYTTNGSTPTSSSTEYTAPVNVATDTTIKATCVTPGLSNSNVNPVFYHIGLLNWYVRHDGGTALQCDGLHNAPLAGATGNQCAYNNPYYLVTNNTDNSAFAWKIMSGDTVYFDQGPFYIGQGHNGLGTTWLNATCSNPTNCTLPETGIPAGTAAYPTRFLGNNYGSCHNSTHTALVNPTVFEGINSVYWMWSLQGSNHVDMECFEFTQPDTCSPYLWTDYRMDNSALSGGVATYGITLESEVFPGVGELLNVSGTTNGGGLLDATLKPVTSVNLSQYTITGVSSSDMGDSDPTNDQITYYYTLVSGHVPEAVYNQTVWVRNMSDAWANTQRVVISASGGTTGTFTIVAPCQVKNADGTVCLTGVGTNAYRDESGLGTNSGSAIITISGMPAGTVATAADSGTFVNPGKCVLGTNDWADTAIDNAEGTNQGPSNLTLRDIKIHRIGSRGFKGSHFNKTPDDVTNLSDIYMYGNGFTGFDSDSGAGHSFNASTGTINVDYLSAIWSGCIETQDGTGVNYCVDQAFYGNGDNVVMVSTGGTWNWNHIITKWGTQDGVDLLHMGDDPTIVPTVNMSNLYSEGNEGASIKAGGSHIVLRDSIGISNCYSMMTASNYPSNPAGWNARLGLPCRASDGMAFAPQAGSSITVQHVVNITEFSTSWDFLNVDGCAGTCTLIFEDNATFGNVVHGDGRVSGPWYFTGPDIANNPGSRMSHNSWYNTRGQTSTVCKVEAVETNEVCTDPKFASESDINHFDVHLLSGSPLTGAATGVSGLKTDFAGNNWVGSGSIGALESAFATSLGTVAAPTCTPAAGTYSSIQTVTCSSTTPGSTTYCTTDGSTPSPSSPVCTNISIAVMKTIKAYSTASSYTDSSITSAPYVISIPTPGVQLIFGNGGFVGNAR